MSDTYIDLPAGPEGPPGPVGPPGPPPSYVKAVQLPFIAAVAITAMQMVVSVDGVHATIGNDNTIVTNARVIGIALTSAAIGVTFQCLLFGTIADTSFSGFGINTPAYLSHTGFLTATLPTRPDFMVICGKYIGANTMFINISLPVQL